MAEGIAEDANYRGIRVKFVGYLESARVPIQIDLGFGDAITPAPVETTIPVLGEKRICWTAEYLDLTRYCR
jgi:hypothetical protein